jgi:hypothetical protein
MDFLLSVCHVYGHVIIKYNNNALNEQPCFEAGYVDCRTVTVVSNAVSHIFSFQALNIQYTSSIPSAEVVQHVSLWNGLFLQPSGYRWPSG